MVVNRDGGFILGVLEAVGLAEDDSGGGGDVVSITVAGDVTVSEGGVVVVVDN